MATPMASLMLAPPFPQHQADEVVTQASPVSGTIYTILDTVHNCRLIAASAKVVWTVQPNLQIHVIIDGNTLTGTHATPITNTGYEFIIRPDETELGGTLYISSGPYGPYRAGILLEGKSVKVQMETTGGTTSSLVGRVKYALIR